MCNELHEPPLTNENLWQYDFCRKEKLALIRSVASSKPIRYPLLAPGLSSKAVWMIDVSILDKRSVKAQLAGKGDFRSSWWNLNCFLHRLFRPQDSMETVMTSFQKRCSRIDTFFMEFTKKFRQKTQTRIGLLLDCMRYFIFRHNN